MIRNYNENLPPEADIDDMIYGSAEPVHSER